MNSYNIIYNGKEYIPSEYQKAIFDNVVHGIGNMVIEASAGSGKTTTIVNIINLIDKDKRSLFIAFNKDIVKVLKDRVGKNRNSDIMTYHSLGYAILREYYRDKIEDIDEYKYRTYVKHNISKLCNNNTYVMGLYNKPAYINNICQLIEYARYNLCQSIREINDIANKYGVVVQADECEVVKKVLEWGSDNIKTIDYTDMIWLPNEMGIIPRKYKYDWVLIDESQDTSIAQQKLFFKCFKRNTRFIAVGDTYQSINIWAGASEEALNNLKEQPNTKIFSLPISYRCPKKVVQLAQVFSPDIKYADDAIDGEVNYDVKKSKPQSGDMVLCRSTAPLVKLYVEYLRMNKKAYIRGKDIGKNLISLIEDSNTEMVNRTMVTNGLISSLYERLFSLRSVIMNKWGLDDKDACTTMEFLNLYDSIKAIEVLSEGIDTCSELINKIETIFLDSDGDGVCLSTVHKAKGLESDNIFILCKSLMPSKLAKKEWEKKTEDNLIYVAITRAKKSLNYIDENDFNIKEAYLNTGSMMKELTEIENGLRTIKGNHIDEIGDVKLSLIKTRVIGQREDGSIEKIKEEEKNKKNNKNKAFNKFKKFI